MSLFKNLTSEGLEKTQDRLGGFQVIDTDAYEATIKVAYAGSSDSGAMFVAFEFLLANGQEYQETLYVTNRNGENFFRNQQDPNKKIPLPGFVTVDNICMLTTEKTLAEQDHEEKLVNVYDKDAGQKVPKPVPVLVDLIGKQVVLGITKNLENKSVKDGNGVYQPTAETRETNTIEVCFHYPSLVTMVEARNGADHPAFHAKWIEANKGKAKDKRKIKDGQAAGGAKTGKPGGAPQAGGEAPKSSGLFNKK